MVSSMFSGDPGHTETSLSDWKHLILTTLEFKMMGTGQPGGILHLQVWLIAFGLAH